MEEWGSWLQGVAGGLIDKWGTAEYVQPYNLQAMRLQALGQLGMYEEGQTGRIMQAGAVPQINGTWLIAGGVILAAVLLLKD